MATYGSSFSGERTSRAIAPRRSNAAGSQVQLLAEQLARQIVDEQNAQRQKTRSGRVYTSFDPANDILGNNVATVTTGLFTGNTGSLISMFTQSGQTAAQNSYFHTVFNGLSTIASSQPQFSIAYGNFNGSGSRDTTGNLNNDTPSRAIYKQYAQILLPPNDLKFTIGGKDTDHIYVLNFNRSRFREKLDPGNLEINLAIMSSSYNNNGNTGSMPVVASGNQIISLIDDSSTAPGEVGENGKIYNIISGSIDNGTTIFNSAKPHQYGLLYPEYGIVVLDADVLNQSASFGTVTGSAVAGDNPMKLFKSLSGSAAIAAPSTRNYGLQARSSEQLKSSYYFVRVKNGDYNYSNNPSYVTGSFGELKYSTFVNDPQTYITTVGLYNTNRELLAVSKLSQPLLKNRTREVLIKVKLDF